MRLSSPQMIALLAAIAVATIHFWTFPVFILDGLGVEPTGMPVREAFNIQTIDGLEIARYNYLLSALLAFSTFGTVYFGQTLRAPGSWIIIASCAVPLISNFLLIVILPVYLPILVTLGLAVWLIIAGRKAPLFLPGCYSLGVNFVAAIAMPLYNDALWALMT